MKTVNVLLDNISKIQTFNKKVLLFPGEHLDLVSGRYRVAAKSLMGLFSLDLSKPVTMEYEEQYESYVEELFRHFIQ